MASAERVQKEIPLLKDVSVAKREVLFLQKVEVCTTVYRFDNDLGTAGAADSRGKEIKRQTLMELLDFVNTAVGVCGEGLLSLGIAFVYVMVYTVLFLFISCKSTYTYIQV